MSTKQARSACATARGLRRDAGNGELMERTERAVGLKHDRNNCCQAVVRAFVDVCDLPEETLSAMGAPFGSGMGNMEGTCGALVGAEMALGLARANGRACHRDAAELLEGFRRRCGSTICSELKGRDTGVILCPCDDCVRNAVLELERMLGE